MSADLLDTWREMAAHFDDWGPPLRPASDAVASYVRLVASWRGADPTALPAMLLGVTPELALAPWPVPLRLTAVDLSEPMLRLVWPGDVPGVRQGVRADWMQFEPPERPALVLTDGAPVFFGDPVPLFTRVRHLLAAHGRFVFRGFCAPERQEHPADVLADARAGRIANFHVLKWRMAMAMQADARTGVVQHAVWQALTQAGLDMAALPQPGFSAAAVSTLRFYEGKRATLHFPTRDGYVHALRQVFAHVDVDVPGGLFGTQCPVFMAHGRA